MHTHPITSKPPKEPFPRRRPYQVDMDSAQPIRATAHDVTERWLGRKCLIRRDFAETPKKVCRSDRKMHLHCCLCPALPLTLTTARDVTAALSNQILLHNQAARGRARGGGEGLKQFGNGWDSTGPIGGIRIRGSSPCAKLTNQILAHKYLVSWR